MIESRRSTDYLLEMNKTNHLFITAPKKREREGQWAKKEMRQNRIWRRMVQSHEGRGGRRQPAGQRTLALIIAMRRRCSAGQHKKRRLRGLKCVSRFYFCLCTMRKKDRPIISRTKSACMFKRKKEIKNEIGDTSAWLSTQGRGFCFLVLVTV